MQWAPLFIFHHDIGGIVFPQNRKHTDYIRMLEPGQGLRFTDKALQSPVKPFTVFT